MLKDFLPTSNKVTYLNKGKWCSSEILASGFKNAELAPIKVIHQGQLSQSQYHANIASINKALHLIKSSDETLFEFICAFTTHLCIADISATEIYESSPVPGISFINLAHSSDLKLCVEILQTNALHFLNATLILHDFIIDEMDDIYFDFELNTPVSILDILRRVQTSYWPLVFLLKLYDVWSHQSPTDNDMRGLLTLLLEYNFKATIYEDYLEHALQTYKLTPEGKNFNEQFLKSVKDASSRIQSLDSILQNKFPDESKKLKHQLDIWREIKKKHSLNH